jgi:hypothetical protein
MERHRLRTTLLLLLASAFLGVATPAAAQFMFLDVNGDGACTSADILSSSVTSVDIWLDTNHNGDGSLATCPTGEDLTINSYTFILTAPSGGVTYGAWTDNMGFTIAAGGAQSGNDFWIAKASGTPLAAGKYKLGSLAVTITGSPSLQFAIVTAIDPTGLTSFGSACPGMDFDNTMKFGTDWINACSVGVTTAVQETTWGKIKNLYR